MSNLVSNIAITHNLWEKNCHKIRIHHVPSSPGVPYRRRGGAAESSSPAAKLKKKNIEMFIAIFLCILHFLLFFANF